MLKYVVVKPTFAKGNVGDAALISTIKKQNSDKTLFIPEDKNQLNNIDVNRFDALIYFGNDCVPYYSSCVPQQMINKFLNKNKKVYIINTSWGSNPRKDGVNFLKSVENNPNFKIFMRDLYSFELVQKSFKFKNEPILTADLALLCETNNINNIDKLDNWINNDNKPIIGINSHNDFKEFNEIVRVELIKFMEKNCSKYRFLFIPHDSRKNEYEDLQNLYKSSKNIDGFVCNYLDPEYEKYITSKLFLVIAGRMHLSILTIPNGVPCIAIEYNGIKAKGTFKHFDIDDLVLTPNNITDINNLFNTVCINYDKYVDKIKSNIQKVEFLVKNQILL